MQVWELNDEEGRTFAIEVPSIAGRRRVVRLVEQVEGVRVLRAPRIFSWLREEVFCEFELDGEPYEISEPFGDNSRYLIGKPESGWHPSFHRVVAVFRDSSLWFGKARNARIAV
jgi:hypothetical protein